MTIARGLSRIEDPACFPRWALQIVQRRSVDRIRRRKRERRSETELEKFNKGSVIESSKIGGDMAKLSEAISNLSESDRGLLRLFYESGRSVAEIS